MAATRDSLERGKRDSGDQSSSLLVVVVRSAQHRGVCIYRPDLPGWRAPHIVFLAERGLTDRDILYRSWHLLNSEECKIVSESFGIDQSEGVAMKLSREVEDRKFDHEYEGILNPWMIENADLDADENAEDGNAQEE